MTSIVQCGQRLTWLVISIVTVAGSVCGIGKVSLIGRVDPGRWYIKEFGARGAPPGVNGVMQWKVGQRSPYRTAASMVLLNGLCGILLCTGCAIGQPGFLDDYATVGGAWERTDPTTGRVGSILSDPNAAAALADVTHSTEEVEQRQRYEESQPRADAPQVESSTYYYDSDDGVYAASYYDDGGSAAR